MTRCLILFSFLLLAGCAISPQPLTHGEVESRALADLEAMIAGQQPMGDQPISLYEAMARAVKYNLDKRLKIMEEALETRQYDVARLDLLPDLAASAGYHFRNNDFGSHSRSLIDGTESLVPSTSQDRRTGQNDITLMWNVLDFGVSYARARQHADRILIAAERRRKVIQNIVQDVRYAYYRAVSSDLLIRDMMGLFDKTKSALARAREIETASLQRPRDVLEYQRSLLENMRLLWRLVQELSPARVELATLMNLPPGTTFTLVEPDWSAETLPDFTTPVARLEYLALVSRPELREEDYKLRINVEEMRKSLLQMLPGIKLDLSANYDTNSFLVNNRWWDAAALITQNVMNLFTGPANYQAAKTQQEVDGLRRQALSLAVLMQVHLARQKFFYLKEEYQVTRRLDDINGNLNRLMTSEEQAGSATDLGVVQTTTSAFVARMRHHLAYAELQNAAARIYASVGLDPLPPDLHNASLPVIADTLRETFAKWDQAIERADSGQEKELSLPAVLAGTGQDDGAGGAKKEEQRAENDLVKVARLANQEDKRPTMAQKEDRAVGPHLPPRSTVSYARDKRGEDVPTDRMEEVSRAPGMAQERPAGRLDGGSAAVVREAPPLTIPIKSVASKDTRTAAEDDRLLFDSPVRVTIRATASPGSATAPAVSPLWQGDSVE